MKLVRVQDGPVSTTPVASVGQTAQGATIAGTGYNPQFGQSNGSVALNIAESTWADRSAAGVVTTYDTTYFEVLDDQTIAVKAGAYLFDLRSQVSWADRTDPYFGDSNPLAYARLHLSGFLTYANRDKWTSQWEPLISISPPIASTFGVSFGGAGFIPDEEEFTNFSGARVTAALQLTAGHYQWAGTIIEDSGFTFPLSPGTRTWYKVTGWDTSGTYDTSWSTKTSSGILITAVPPYQTLAEIEQGWGYYSGTTPDQVPLVRRGSSLIAPAYSWNGAAPPYTGTDVAVTYDPNFQFQIGDIVEMWVSSLGSGTATPSFTGPQLFPVVYAMPAWATSNTLVMVRETGLIMVNDVPVCM